MSKVDAQRAMKVARHARSAAPSPEIAAPRAGAAAAATRPAEGGTVAGRPAAPARTAPTAPAGATATVVGTTTASGTTTCGHRSMAGKECRRPAGHPEKSHRYT